MTAAFFRLAFITACCAFVFGLVEVARYTTIAVALVVGFVGNVLAICLGEDWSAPAAKKKRE